MVKYVICNHKKQVRFLLLPFVKIKCSLKAILVNMNYIFVNKNKRNKDKHICINYSKNFFDFFVITNLNKIKNLDIEKKLIYLILINNQNLLKNKYNYLSTHKDISFLSGRTKSVITKYGIARTDFKKLMIYHQIPNLKKSSW